MIRIQKAPKPKVLIDNAAAWTRDLRLIRTANGKESTARKRYREKSIVDSLKQETNGKCCYCECEVSAGMYKIVEHILPWSIFYQLAYFWSNLLLVCERCNNAKGDKYNPLVSHVNPIRHNPTDHLLFAGPVVLARSPEGRRSLIDIRLNRPDLYESRRKHLRKLEQVASGLRESARNAVLQSAYMDEDSVYSECSTTFIKINY